MVEVYTIGLMGVSIAVNIGWTLHLVLEHYIGQMASATRAFGGMHASQEEVSSRMPMACSGLYLLDFS